MIRCTRVPNRSSPRVFNERDCGRIISHAREDGANDTLLVAYILQAFGLREIFCFLFSILDILNKSLFLSALITILQGLINLLKVAKIAVTGRTSFLKSAVEFLIPKRFLGQWAKLLLFIGASQIVVGGMLVFITSLANNIDLTSFMKSVCNAPTRPFVIPVSDLPLGTLFKSFVDLKIQMEEIERLRKEIE